MNKRMRITIFVTCALLMCLMATSALADTSTAHVLIGDTYDKGSSANLSSSSYLSGRVRSASGSGSGLLTGSLFTGNVFGPFYRGGATVGVGGSLQYGWQPDGSGYHYSTASAPDGNHDGSARSWQ